MNLRVLADSLAVRVEFDGSGATGVLVVREGQNQRMSADVVVLCCGSYGNPPLLMRSGVSPEAQLEQSAILKAASGYWHPVGTCGVVRWVGCAV